jgi:hypothetical protein
LGSSSALSRIGEKRTLVMRLFVLEAGFVGTDDQEG